MLLAGCFGAMLPVWMKLDPSMVEETSGGVAKPVEEGTDDRTNEVAPRVSTWKVNSSLVVMTIISCVCLIIFSLSWELYASVAMLVGFFASWQFVNVVFYARIATCISESGAMYSQLVRNFRSRNSNGSISNQDYHRSTEVDVGRRSLLGAGGTSSDSFGIQSSHLSVPTYADDGDTSLRVGNDSVIDEREQALVEELPPYSVSIIFLITASVLFQVIIQIILFSSLQLSLKPISIILTFLFCVFSFIFCLDVIRYHLWQSS